MSNQAWMSWRSAAGALLVAGVVSAGDAAAQPVPTDRVVARVDFGWQSVSRTFAATTEFELFEEGGHFKSLYQPRSGGVVEGGISFLLWRNLAVGVDVSRLRSATPALLSTAVPHPFLFGFHRMATGVADGLERQQLVVSLRALWMMQLGDWLVVSAGGGPNFSHVRQDLVSSVEHSDGEFPFIDTVVVGHTADERSGTSRGFGAGIEVYSFALHRVPWLRSYQIVENIGLGLLIRYAWSSAPMTGSDGGLVPVDLGGLQLTMGLRFRL